MGTESSKFSTEKEISQDFRPLHKFPDIYENVLTGVRLHKKKIRFSSHCQLEYEKDIFLFRRLNSDRIVTAYYFDNIRQNEFCSMSHEVSYFIEVPAKQFSLKDKLPTDICFKYLVESLKGFEILFNKFGPFRILHNQICYDNNNNIKVWIHHSYEMTKIQNVSNEQEMVQAIFDIFDIMKDERGNSFNFNSYLHQYRLKMKTSLTFQKVMNFLVKDVSKYFTIRDKKSQINLGLVKEKDSTCISKQISLKSRKRNPSSGSILQKEYYGIKNAIECNRNTQYTQNTQLSTYRKNTRRYNSQQNCSTVDHEGSPYNLPLMNSLQNYQSKNMKQNITVKKHQYSSLGSTQSTKFNVKSEDKNVRVSIRSNCQKNSCSETPPNELWHSQNTNRRGVGEPEKNSSKLITGKLSELQTIKSIQDYSSLYIDSAIRIDLERMEVNAESRLK